MTNPVDLMIAARRDIADLRTLVQQLSRIVETQHQEIRDLRQITYAANTRSVVAASRVAA